MRKHKPSGGTWSPFTWHKFTHVDVQPTVYRGHSQEFFYGPPNSGPMTRARPTKIGINTEMNNVRNISVL